MRPTAALVFAAAASLLAQTGARDTYRTAYRSWREAEPALERDAATAGEALGPRASRAAGEAARFHAARSEFLRQWAETNAQGLAGIRSANPSGLKEVAPAADLLRLVNNETTLVSNNISNFANDSDRGIQQLRQAMERERGALEALRSAITDRQTAQDKVAQTETAIDQNLATAQEQYQSIIGAIRNSGAAVDKEGAAWGSYYQKLAEGARTAPALTSAVRPNAPTGASNSAPASRPPSITPLPLVRYTGGWTFPTVNGLFHGAEPEFVDFVVHEENGKATGTFYGRFKLPPGSTGDPVVRFDFSGDFRPTRNQVFNLETADGSKGTVELIPGNAFNLIEVTFQMESKPGRVQRADVILIKK